MQLDGFSGRQDSPSTGRVAAPLGERVTGSLSNEKVVDWVGNDEAALGVCAAARVLSGNATPSKASAGRARANIATGKIFHRSIILRNQAVHSEPLSRIISPLTEPCLNHTISNAPMLRHSLNTENSVNNAIDMSSNSIAASPAI